MKKWLVTLLLPLTLVACSANDNSESMMSSDSPQVILDDSTLDDYLSIEDITTQEVNGLAEGIVAIKNNYSGDLQLQYRFYWYDEEGFEVNTRVPSWETFVVRGLDTADLKEVAVRPEATQFRVSIRKLD